MQLCDAIQTQTRNRDIFGVVARATPLDLSKFRSPAPSPYTLQRLEYHRPVTIARFPH
jgi:hypothetical protein